MTKEKEGLTAKLAESTEKLNESRAKRQAIESSLKKAQEMGVNENDRHLFFITLRVLNIFGIGIEIILFLSSLSIYKRLEELLLVHDGLKEQEHNFREQCKSDLNLLRGKLQETESGTSEEEEDRLKEYEEQKEAVTKARLQLAKKNRAIASLTRQLDDVPGRSELTQYQRRFMELYNQG